MPPVFEAAPSQLPTGRLAEGKLSGSRVRWWSYGPETAPLLVMVHGFRGDHHGLEPIVAGLENYRVLIPDLPGFGRSEPLEAAGHTVENYAAWLLDWLELAAPGQKPHLVGHSFGSMVAAYAAMVRPSAFSLVSLINPICQPALEGDQKLISKLAELYYDLGSLLPQRLGFGLLRSQLVTRITSRVLMKNSDPQLQAFIDGQHAAYFGAFSSRQALLEAYRSSISTTAAYYSPAISLPVQMIVGEQDDLGSLALQEEMASQLQAGRLEVIPQVGHLVHYETPLRAARLISDFHQQGAPA